jgi:hypothetical protein
MSVDTMKYVYFPTLKLEFVKALKNAAKGTVNDVLLAATSGAIRRYCIKMGDPAFTPGADKASPQVPIQVRALLPVAFPRSEAESKDDNRCMRNKFAFIAVPLPVGSETTKERLDACAAEMAMAKKSPDSIVQLWLQDNILSLAPKFVARQAAFDTFSRISLVFSNLPGPAETTYLAGEPIVGIQPSFPNLVSQAIIMSYNGAVFMNMVVDSKVITDIPALTNAFLDEIKSLAKEYGVEATDAIMLAPMSSGGVFGITESKK